MAAAGRQNGSDSQHFRDDDYLMKVPHWELQSRARLDYLLYLSFPVFVLLSPEHTHYLPFRFFCLRPLQLFITIRINLCNQTSLSFLFLQFGEQLQVDLMLTFHVMDNRELFEEIDLKWTWSGSGNIHNPITIIRISNLWLKFTINLRFYCADLHQFWVSQLYIYAYISRLFVLWTNFGCLYENKEEVARDRFNWFNT